MSTEQCWSRDPTGSRCPQPAVPPTHFCASHSRSGPPNPLTIFRAPEAEMPTDLVAAIRRYSPEATFPPPPARAPVSPLTPPPTAPAAAPKDPGRRALESGSWPEPPGLREPGDEPEVEFLFEPDPLASASSAGASGVPPEGRVDGAGPGPGTPEADRQVEADRMRCRAVEKYEEAIRLLEETVAFSPKDPHPLALDGLQQLHALRGEAEPSLAYGRRFVEQAGETDVDRCSPVLPEAVVPSEVAGESAPPGVTGAPSVSASRRSPSSRGDEAPESATRQLAEYGSAPLIGSAVNRAPP